MAENEDTTDQKDAGTGAGENLLPGEEKEQEGEGKSKLLIVIIAIVLVAIVSISITLFFLLSEKDEIGITGTEEEKAYVEEFNKKMQTSIIEVTNPIFTDPMSYTVNLKDRKHMIRLSIVAELQDPLASKYLSERRPIIDDTLITLLKNKKTEDLTTRAGLELLKRDIYRALNGMYPEEFFAQSELKDRTPVKKILIKEFFIQ